MDRKGQTDDGPRSLHKAVALLAAALLGGAAPPSPAMVVTAQHDATQAGVDVLRAGGNAVDAAVAVGYALAVTDPCCGNIGGGGFMLMRLHDGRERFIDFRETAPERATSSMYLDAHGNVRPGASTKGWLAVGVPGTVAGLETARREFGTMSRARLLAPAIALARDGFVVVTGDELPPGSGARVGAPLRAAAARAHARSSSRATAPPRSTTVRSRAPSSRRAKRTAASSRCATSRATASRRRRRCTARSTATTSRRRRRPARAA